MTSEHEWHKAASPAAGRRKRSAAPPAGQRRRSAGHCARHPAGNTFRCSQRRCERDARGLPLAIQPQHQRGSSLQFCSDRELSSDRGSAPIAEVSSRINFSLRHNEILLKTFAAVTVIDLFNNSKKFPHSRDFNHSGIRS